MVRAPNGAQYIIQQPQQQILLQQQMQPGGVQAPVIQQVHHITQKQTPSVGESWPGLCNNSVLLHSCGSSDVEEVEEPTYENNWFMGKEPVFPNKLLYMTFISVGISYSKMHLKRFRLFTVYAGPGSSAGRPAPANRSHHPAAADCLSFRKQSARQHTGQHFLTSFITDLTDLICKCALNFNASFC